jgi:hypothetical protein
LNAAAPPGRCAGECGRPAAISVSTDAIGSMRDSRV